MDVGDFLMQRLHAWGVRRVFAYPGDGINGLVGAFDRADTELGLQFIQVRHEEQAAFMACAHAKFTGEVGVCMATTGPGAIHLLNGLYDAKGDKTPVVAIVGGVATTAVGSSYQQEIATDRLFEDVCEYVAVAESPMAIRHIVDRAFRVARGLRGVACVVVPKDVQEQTYRNPPMKHDTAHSSVGMCDPIVVPHEADLRRAAEILNAGERVAMLVGKGAKYAPEEVIAVADRLGAGLAKALLGKAVIPDDLPFVTGTLGLLGTRASSEMMWNCDTLLMVGTSYPYAEFLPKADRARGIQIDIDPRYIGLRFPTELNLIGDAGATLRALLPLLRQRTDTSWRERIAGWRATSRNIEATRTSETTTPMNPETVFTELDERLPDNVILTLDAGTSTNWAGRNLTMRPGMDWSLSGTLATMGSAVPYAIAAKLAFPDRPVIALTGDGAMQMNGINEMLTAMRYRDTWRGRDERLIFCVLRNDDLNQVTWEMRIESGDPKYCASQELPGFSYARYADLIGMRGIRCERREDIAGAWDAALGSDVPVILEMVVDANVSLLPPHISLKQAHELFSALRKGDPDEGGVIRASVEGVLSGLFPTKTGGGEGVGGAYPHGRGEA